MSGAYNEIQATGHGDLVQAHDGSWWMVFLGIRKRGGHPGWHHLGRETFLAPVTWENGWPVVNDGEPIEGEMCASETDLERRGEQSWSTRQPFDGDRLSPEWNYRFAPDSDRYELEDGSLTLRGSAASLDDRDATFVGRRQQHFECRVRTDLAFDPAESEEAGLAVVYDESHHYELGITRRDGTLRAMLRRTIGDVTERTGESSPVGDSVTLVLEATADAYQFGIETDDGEEHLGTAPTRYLATEVAGGFTGVYVGLYASGRGSPSETPARFDSFTYRPGQ